MSSIFVTTLDLALAQKLQQDLESQGFEIKKPPYTLFAASKKGVACTLYTSGKLTVQGKDKDDFIAFYLEPEILGALTYTHPEITVDKTARIGIDESGKGDFFGPLCIAGIQANGEQIDALLGLGVKDSKLMQDPQIHKLASQIKELVPHSLIRLYPSKYNELYTKFGNLNRLLAWGHATAIEELVTKTGCKIVTIDQFAAEEVVAQAVKRKGLDITLTQRHRGESDVVVAAASILARDAFVKGLLALSDEVGLPLPKGASALVKAAGRRVVSEKGREALGRVAKLHFKTASEVLF